MTRGRNRWTKRLAWVASIAVVAVLAAGVWLWNSDLGRFKGAIEAELSSRLGAELRFEDLSIELGPGLRIESSGITLNNPAWTPQPRVLDVGRLEARIVLGSLLGDGPVEVEDLGLSGVRLAWLRNAEGRSNLDFLEAMDEHGATDDASAMPVLLRRARIEDFNLHLEDALRAAPIDVRVDTLSLDIDERNMVDVDLEGHINGEVTDYRGKVGPYDALLRGKAIRLEGSGRFGTLRLDGTAMIDDLSAPNRPEFQIAVSGPDIRDVERMLGLEPRGAGGYDLALGAVDAPGGWSMDLDGRLGALRLSANGSADGLRDLARFDLDVQGSGPDLARILRLFGQRDWPSERFQLDGRVRRRGPSLEVEDIELSIGDSTFALTGSMNRFPHLAGGRLHLQASGPALERFRALFGLPGMAAGPFELTADLQSGEDGRDRIEVHLDSGIARIDIDGELSGADGYVGTVARASASGDDAGAILSTFGIDGFGGAPFDLEGILEVEADRVRVSSARLEGPLAAIIEASGSVGLEPMSPATTLDLQAAGHDLAAVLQSFGIDAVRDRVPFRVVTTMQASPEALRFDELTASAGDTTLSGRFSMPVDGDADGFEARFEAAGPNLGAVLSDRVSIDVPDVPWRAGAQLRRSERRIVIEGLDVHIEQLRIAAAADLPWPPTLGAGDFSLRARGADLARALPRLGRFEFAPQAFEIQLEGALDDGVWRFQPSTLSLGGARAGLSGSLGHPPTFDATDLELELDIPDLAALGTLRRERLPSEPIALGARLSGSRTRLAFDAVRIVAGPTEVDGSGRVDFAGETPSVTLRLTSPRMDLRPVMPEPVESRPQDDDHDGRMIPDVPLPLEALASVDADIALDIAEITTHRRIIRDVDLRASISEGALALDRYHSTGVIGELWASGHVRPKGDGRAVVDLKLRAADLVPGFEAWRTADPATLPKLYANMDISATGAGLRELAAVVDGQLDVVATEGRLPGRGLGALESFVLAQLLNLLVPGYEPDTPTELRCLAARFVARDGILTTEPAAALKTGRLLIMSSGTLNLRDESIDMGFQTTPTRLLGVNLAELVNPFVRIRGTLADPRPEVDPKGTLIYGGAAAATAGLTLLAQSVWNRLKVASDPCERLRDEIWSEAGLPQTGNG